MEEQDLLRKVSALLAKAEGTDNEHEASAFFEKAHELMLTYAIDEARVRAEQRRIHGNKIEEPLAEDYMYSSYAHHATAKSALLKVVCKSRSVRSMPYGNRKGSNDKLVAAAGATGLFESQWTRFYGYKTDIEAVKLLYLSLLIQSQQFAAEDWRSRYGDAKISYDEGQPIGRFTWITGHMEGFAYRIGERFDELTKAIYAQTADGQALIVDKDANILEWMYEHGYATRPRPASEPRFEYCGARGIPKGKRSERMCLLRKGHTEGENPTPHQFTYKATYSYYVSKGRTSSYEGHRAGRSAADRADIGHTRIGQNAKLLR